MKFTKSVAAGAVVVVSFALVTACSGDKGGTSTSASGAPGASSSAASPAKSLSATEQFTSALTKSSTTTHKFSANIPDATFEGSVDPAASLTIGKISADVDGTKLSIETQLTPTVYYARITGLPLPGLDGSKWLKLDPKKVTSSRLTSFGEVYDPTGMKAVQADLVTVESTDGKSFKGTLDFTKSNWGPVDKDSVTGLADKAKTVPFTATVDDKGYVTSLKVSVPAYGDQKANDTVVTQSDFGVPVTAASPAPATVIDAPDTVYALLNSK